MACASWWRTTSIAAASRSSARSPATPVAGSTGGARGGRLGLRLDGVPWHGPAGRGSAAAAGADRPLQGRRHPGRAWRHRGGDRAAAGPGPAHRAERHDLGSALLWLEASCTGSGPARWCHRSMCWSSPTARPWRGGSRRPDRLASSGSRGRGRDGRRPAGLAAAIEREITGTDQPWDEALARLVSRRPPRRGVSELNRPVAA